MVDPARQAFQARGEGKRSGLIGRSEQSSNRAPQALEIIWRKFPRTYNAGNSIHIDDLGRNFVMKYGLGDRAAGLRKLTCEAVHRTASRSVHTRMPRRQDTQIESFSSWQSQSTSRRSRSSTNLSLQVPDQDWRARLSQRLGSLSLEGLAGKARPVWGRRRVTNMISLSFYAEHSMKEQ